MQPEQIFDFKNPDYATIYKRREARLIKIRQNSHLLPGLKAYYKQNIAQFIIDFGCTSDPRNPERGLPSAIPFILFPKQIEWVDWAIAHWKAQKPGLVEKTRTVGMSWLSVAFACSMCIFYPQLSIGFGSRKQDYVDKIGDLDSLLEKARRFISLLPKEFRAGFDVNKTSKLMLLTFPETDSTIKGETGDGIGRGGRNSMYFVDESAFLERPYLIDASLSENTNCRFDVSTPNGIANSFAERRFSGRVDIFTFHWRDDPRRDDEWYRKKCYEINNPVIIAQEFDINYAASVTGVVIPSEWIQSAIDAHIKLGIKPTGQRKGAWDVADEGGDMNAFTGRYGILLEHAEIWSGINGDILQSAQKVFTQCDLLGYKTFDYDADGLGAAARGDSRIINEKRDRFSQIIVYPFRGSESVQNPTGQIVSGTNNEDMFVNRKAQAWWMLRLRFQNTHRAVSEGFKDYKPDELISIDSKLPLLNKIMSELAQPTWSSNTAGKILIDKKPEGTKSPNIADSIMINYANNQVAITNWGGAKQINKNNITRELRSRN
jgi:hypothetical protein